MNSSRGWLASVALAVAGAIMTPNAARADVKLPAVFSDHLVLQRGAVAPVWGWAEPGEEVTVAIGGQSHTAKANQEGRWLVKLAALQQGGPHTLTVQGKNKLTVDDVLVGEVWLGSGQSNMAMTVNRVNDAEEEQAAAKFPQIRMFTVGSNAAAQAQDDCTGSWVVCTPESVGRFSATAYFFGRELHRKLAVPVGLINSSVGGTPIESWISPEAQHTSPELKSAANAAVEAGAKFDEAAAKEKYDRDLAKWQAAVAKAKAANQPPPRKPADPVETRRRKGNVGGLFNGKIAPLVGYGIRGAIWYQGEANSSVGKAELYQHQLPLLVQDWRTRWGHDFPFAWVQLPNFNGAGRDWPLVREAMLHTLRLPKTGMAITIDIGEATDIHPKNKQDVGRRLAAWALGSVYGQAVATSGPLADRHERRGNTIAVHFKHADGGLVARDGALRGFTLAGGDMQFKPASARIDGTSVLVTSPEVSEPVAVRYAWENNPSVNFYNGAGLPASPFRLGEK